MGIRKILVLFFVNRPATTEGAAAAVHPAVSTSTTTKPHHTTPASEGAAAALDRAVSTRTTAKPHHTTPASNTTTKGVGKVGSSSSSRAEKPATKPTTASSRAEKPATKPAAAVGLPADTRAWEKTCLRSVEKGRSQCGLVRCFKSDNKPNWCPRCGMSHSKWSLTTEVFAEAQEVRSAVLPFDEALAFARSLGLSSQAAWRAWCKEGLRPASVPSRPAEVYKGAGWQGWGQWLGTGNEVGSEKKEFLPFGKALAVVRSLNLANEADWRALGREGRRPPNVPAHPEKVYKDCGWRGLGHWLGSSGIKQTSRFLPFRQALAFAHSLNLASQHEWKVWCRGGRRPSNVPAHPEAPYKDDGWQGWAHWLGSSNTGEGKKQMSSASTDVDAGTAPEPAVADFIREDYHAARDIEALDTDGRTWRRVTVRSAALHPL